MSTLGEFIRARRMELGLTQEALAARVGGDMRQAEISRLEHDRVTLPRRERMEALAAALEVSLGDLFVSTGWLKPDQRPVTAPPVPDAAQLPDDRTGLIETISELQEIVITASDTLAQAEAALAELIDGEDTHHPGMPGPDQAAPS